MFHVPVPSVAKKPREELAGAEKSSRARLESDALTVMVCRRLASGSSSPAKASGARERDPRDRSYNSARPSAGVDPTLVPERRRLDASLRAFVDA